MAMNLLFGAAHTLRSAILSALVLAGGTGLAAAQETAKPSEVSNFLLANGMEVVVIPDRRAPVVTHMVWYKVGSADEQPGKSGIAHFFEHLMFKGTQAHPAGELSRRVAEIGGNDNAFTSYDYTGYHQTIPPDALQMVMEIEADRMRNLVLTDDMIATERDVVLEERGSRVENDPNGLLDEEIDATFFQNHPYGTPVIGWLHEIAQLNRDDAAAFYDRYYAPNNAVLVVAGDVEPDAVKTLAESIYGKIPRGPDLPPRIRPKEPEQNTSRTVTLADPRVSLPSFSTSWLVPSYRSAKPGEAEALDLLSEILGGGIRSRLYQELVVKSGLASSAGAYYEGSRLDASAFAVYGSPRGDASLDAVKTAIEAEVAKIVKDGVSEQELASAKKRFVRGMVFARDNAAGLAQIYGATLSVGGNVADIRDWTSRIEKVTAADVRDVASRYLGGRNFVTGFLLPEEKVQN